MFWIMLALYVGSTALSGLLQKAPKIKASALGDMQVPTAEEGRSLPVIWGTCCLKAPNVTWYGDYKCTPIKKSMGIMAFGRKYTAGYRYCLGMDLGLCHGPDVSLVDILAGTGEDLKHIKFSQQSTNPDGSVSVQVDDKNCFGGDDKEGGLAGTGTFYAGSTTQGSDPYMSAKLGIVYPAYRKVCHFVCNQWYFGTQQYIKNLAFVLRRCPSNLGLTAAQSNINGDANPAEIIFECLQVKAWALGFPAPRFDVASFKAAGIKLAAEGMGMSLMLDSPKQADQVIETILQHIDGVCYEDPATGLWTLALARPDYDIASLQEFGPDDVMECEFSRGSWDDTLNEVKVTYTERSTWKQAMVQAQETANFVIRGGDLTSSTMDFPGFSNAAISQKVCNREMRTHSYPIGKGRVKLNRKAWSLRQGSPFKLTWPALGISKMCVRVTSIDYGNYLDGTIEAEICEDVFKAAYTAYAAPGQSSWTNPVTAPVAPVAQIAIEAPYQLLEGNAAPRIMVGAVRADAVSMGVQVWADESGYHQTNDLPFFIPSGVLQGAYPRTTDATDAAGFLIRGMDLETLDSTDTAGRDRGDNLLVFADTGEICAWLGCTANSDGTYRITGIVRGVYDTLPADHAVGARVLFIRNGGANFIDDYKANVLLDTGDDSSVLND